MKPSNDAPSWVDNNCKVWNYFRKVTIFNWLVTLFKHMCSHSRSRQVNILREDEKVPGQWDILSKVMYRASILGRWIIIYKVQKPLIHSLDNIWNGEKHYLFFSVGNGKRKTGLAPEFPLFKCLQLRICLLKHVTWLEPFLTLSGEICFS